ncbi:MAG: [FeFe] hydrogenase H-cluster radical SAM maturase HydE [Candidatus Omnitrophica bacterium]|nr:[FeFe] hydrogenase H-cluster radical SAM maturase HydE [Candidatus Omnitrophota bacterium]
MCYAIPGRVKEIEGRKVTVDYFGQERNALNEIYGLRAGDYIYAQGGYVINKIPEKEAQEILSVWKETFFELQEVDLKLSKLDLEAKKFDSRFSRILDRAMEGTAPSASEALYLFNSANREQDQYLYKAANFLRQKYLKNSCCVHGILEISNHCSLNCRYCGISKLNRNIDRYRMSIQEVVEAAGLSIEKYGFKALVLQSGEDPGYGIEDLCYMIRTIKDKYPALIFISFGEVGLEGLEKLYEAGARGLLMRFETSNQQIYENLHPGQQLSTRLLHLKKAYELGYLILTGGLIGLPGQTREDIINDLFLTKELKAEMYSFGPFLPVPGTPLGAKEPIDKDLMLKVLSIARLIDPTEAKILITTAFETLSKDARRQGLMAGANSVMLNVTPLKYRQQYAIYPDRAYQDELIQVQIEDTLSLLRSLGRAPTDLGVVHEKQVFSQKK